MNKALFLAGLLTLSLHANATSFDCTKAKTWVEKTVCSDLQLSDLDEFLMTAYKKALAQTTDPAVLKRAQRQWLRSVRNQCKDLTCIKQAYASRLIALDALVADPNAFSARE